MQGVSPRSEKITHSATGHGSMCVLFRYCVHLWKERAGWFEPAGRRAVRASLRHYISAELSIFH